MKKKQKTYDKKLKVGEFSHVECDTMEGIFGYTPATIDIKCRYMDMNYAAIKCKYRNECCFKTEIEDRDVDEYPNLFEKDDE